MSLPIHAKCLDDVPTSAESPPPVSWYKHLPSHPRSFKEQQHSPPPASLTTGRESPVNLAGSSPENVITLYEMPIQY